MLQCCGQVRTLQVGIEHWQQWGQLGLGIDHLTFKRGYGWFQRKISCRLIVRGKNLARNTWQKKHSYTENIMCNVGNKILHCACQEKKFCYQRLGKKFLPKPNQPYPPPPPPTPNPLQKVSQWLQTIERLNLQPNFFTRCHWHIINGYVMVICNGYLYCF